ncbi:MAG: hypothetical protein Q7W45_16100 [Bacteroidota bacterium]|nr:hypothetical protein [Bacteroidota bacterium]MDP3145461.1 hypothetical protein [Bacteroidota bacterium]MDP3556417.1 hypothetical protein [Bacteroidota bacterium]
MKKLTYLILATVLVATNIFSQQTDSTLKVVPEKSTLKFNINADGSHYFQATVLNQTWLRFNESNDGTTLFNKNAPTTFDVGLRRTRIQLFGQITDRAFIYFQFGQNNFNNTAGYNSAGTGNRKIAAFFHDALCEYKVSNGNQLKIGAGLTVLNGLSRFSQPSVGTIMTLDVPVFLQYSVDQIDQFDRRLSVYARGQVGKLDYRMYLSNPFPIGSNGITPPAIGKNASFVNVGALPNGYGPGINNQFGTYFAYNFFDNEGLTTPYMQGTYLGTKKVWNVAVGSVYQKAATWNLTADNSGAFKDTTYNNMLHLSFETFLDIPLNKDKGTMLSAFAGYYNTNYGTNYLRYNGLMNPATASTATNLVQGSAYGNALPMFGTGQIVYTQVGLLLPKKLLGEKNGQLMPYLSGQYADYSALQHKEMILFDAGINWFMTGHKSKISIDYQNRPTYIHDSKNDIKLASRKSSVTIQYQITF